MNNSSTVSNDASETAIKLNKYLTFSLGHEEYGVEILKVREIIGLMHITAVPRMPEFVKGVINLRGKVIPVIDLRAKFDMEKIESTEETCIIVVDIHNILIGVFVDRVSEVLDIQESNIEDSPDFGSNVSTDFILGMGKAKDKVIMILDIAKVLSTDEVVKLGRMNND